MMDAFLALSLPFEMSFSNFKCLMNVHFGDVFSNF